MSGTTPALSSAEWATLLDGDDLPALESGDRLAKARDLSPDDAQAAVYAALEDGVLVEDDASGQWATSAWRAHTNSTCGDADEERDGEGYRGTLYERAAARADRETWE